MTTVVLACGPRAADLVGALVADAVTLPDLPGRRDLRLLDDLAAAHLPVDDTPSLEEIAAAPDVPHQGAPQFAPQRPDRPVRVVVVGTDAALSAVVTRLMRIDAMWISVGFVPVVGDGDTSVVARNWQLTTEDASGGGPSVAALNFAMTAPVRPTAVVRDDSGLVTLGSAEIFHGGAELVGEIIVDSRTLFANSSARAWDGRPGAFGARLVPTVDAPGLAATRLVTPSTWDAEAARNVPRRRLFRRPAEPGGVDPDVVMTGRALQAGGVELTVVRDGVVHPRPTSKVTFYRHLRDGQFVRR
ncbi:hypothetical protein [Corynebacterium kalidii]|jgi:hypothetical protein|uniref:Uncharacterized protein n=1 Tax=Corynebacterium kalidii TaxID=2931982 RepID=A0A9X2B0V1_9CORY|nr:hypothetical protein [Corynebacterium kalidii]MCJ7857309.1 hypothetical protein [Corynebacterium kalidii]